jgi:ubiquitin conjugation factor E4 B
MAGGQTYLLSNALAQQTLAPSLSFCCCMEKPNTRATTTKCHNIAPKFRPSWESSEHRLAFRAITQNKESFIKFANGIINKTNTLIATVMQKLPEICAAQEKWPILPNGDDCPKKNKALR